MKRTGMSWIEVLASTVLVALLVVLLIPALVQAEADAHVAKCAANLRAWGTVLRMFAAEHDGQWVTRYVQYNRPASETVSGQRSLWPGPDCAFIYPDYMDDPSIDLCPGNTPLDSPLIKYGLDRRMWGSLIQGPVHESWATDPAVQSHPFYGLPVGTAPSGHRGILKRVLRCSGWSYAYLGVLVDPAWTRTRADIVALTWALGNGSSDAPPGVATWNLLGPNSSDPLITLPGFGVVTLHKLRDGVERTLLTDVNDTEEVARLRAEIPVIWDMLRGNMFEPLADSDDFEANHRPLGANTLYLDGHVEFHTYPAPPGSNPAWHLTELAVTEGYF